MTADLAAPPQTRPPHIPRDWWYRATWHARQAAINTHNQTIRAAQEAERARINRLRATVEAAKAEHDERYHPADTPAANSTPEVIRTIDDMLTWAADTDTILRELNTTAGALEMRMRRAGRTDLARMFASVRNASRYKPCPDCGKNICHASERCRPCSFRAKEVRAA